MVDLGYNCILCKLSEVLYSKQASLRIARLSAGRRGLAGKEKEDSSLG